MMKFEIKHRFSGEILFSIETDSWRLAVEAAIKSKADLRYANLSYADLSSADLRSADLRSADLRYANLSYADLSSADLSYADLRSADLRSADLRSADLSSADLSSANLSSADLRSADLSSANLSSADLLIFQWQGHPAICAGERLTIGCRDKPLIEWAANFEKIGENAGYTELQIQMYGKFIEMCIEANGVSES